MKREDVTGRDGAMEWVLENGVCAVHIYRHADDPRVFDDKHALPGHLISRENVTHGTDVVAKLQTWYDMSEHPLVERIELEAKDCCCMWTIRDGEGMLDPCTSHTYERIHTWAKQQRAALMSADEQRRELFGRQYSDTEIAAGKPAFDMMRTFMDGAKNADH